MWRTVDYIALDLAQNWQKIEYKGTIITNLHGSSIFTNELIATQFSEVFHVSIFIDWVVFVRILGHH